MANRLAKESSPYLLQHAGNPVDWYPWGPEALEKARSEDRPIFLSIGYSSCHWCHVMERESFEREETAEILNRHFVPVKVDREERPDLDTVYMTAVQALTGSGGWPLSVFLTPEGDPFFGGTYFPDRRLHGMPAFDEVLLAVAHAWESRRDDVVSAGTDLAEALRAAASPPPGGEEPLDRAVLSSATDRLAEAFDERHGGFGGAPKFPQPLVTDLLLRRHAATGDPLPLRMAERTLDAMARGGIRDHLGGGFHRYSTDRRWLVPHFEKMLTDNALLARSYLRGWLVTGKEEWKRVAAETLGHLLREMASPAGGFFSALDADTEGREGAYYAWSRDAVRLALGPSSAEPFPPEDVELFLEAYGVTAGGNFEGENVLSEARDRSALAEERGVAEGEVEGRLERMRAALLAARERRPRPGRDGKAIAGWNGLALSALSEGARFLGREDFRRAAEGCGAFLLGPMGAGSGRLLRTWTDGEAKIPAFLDDYALAAAGFLDLYQATFDGRWFAAARTLCDGILSRFADGKGGFLDAGPEHERLVAPPRAVQDGALPSGGAAAATVLLRMESFTGERRYGDAARSALAPLQEALARAPLAFGQWLFALDLALSEPVEVAVVGERPEPFLAVLSRGFRPHVAVACGTGGEGAGVPLLEGRAGRKGGALAYVCRRFACGAPTDDPEELGRLLAGTGAGEAP